MEKWQTIVIALLSVILCKAGVVQSYHNTIEDCPPIALNPPNCAGLTPKWGCDDPQTPDICDYNKFYCNILAIPNQGLRDKLQCWLEQISSDYTLWIQMLYDKSQESEPTPFPSCADGPVMLPYHYLENTAEFIWPPIKQKSCSKLNNTCYTAPCYPRAVESCTACVMVFPIDGNGLCAPVFQYVNYDNHESCSCCTCEDYTTQAECLAHTNQCPNSTDHIVRSSCYWNDNTQECKCCHPSSAPCSSGTFNYANCQCE